MRQCHTLLFTGHPITLTVADFDVHAIRNDIPLVVDFWAPWCGPCRMMAPAYEQAAKILEPHVRLAKVNTEEEQALGARFSIQSIPTIILLPEGMKSIDNPGPLVHRISCVGYAPICESNRRRSLSQPTNG